MTTPLKGDDGRDQVSFSHKRYINGAVSEWSDEPISENSIVQFGPLERSRLKHTFEVLHRKRKPVSACLIWPEGLINPNQEAKLSEHTNLLRIHLGEDDYNSMFEDTDGGGNLDCLADGQELLHYISILGHRFDPESYGKSKEVYFGVIFLDRYMQFLKGKPHGFLEWKLLRWEFSSFLFVKHSTDLTIDH